MNFILGHVSVNEVWPFKMCHLLDHFYRTLCRIARRKVLSKFGAQIERGIHAHGSFKTTQGMFSSVSETPGFHQKADVLEESKEVGKLIHRIKDFLKYLTQFSMEIEFCFRMDYEPEGC